MDLIACRYFVETVRAGTITDAARSLGLSRPTLSRRLTALEEELGLALLHRTTRAVRPTRAGQRLYDRLVPVLSDLDGIEASLHEERDEVAGRLVVSVPPPMAPEVARLLVQLRDAHPLLEVDLRVEGRLVDLRDEVEVALRAGPSPDADVVQRVLARSPIRAVASPAYLDAHGMPAELPDLAHHTLLLGRRADGPLRDTWPLRSGERLPVRGRFASDDQRALLHAAIAGAGIALMSEVTYREALAAGQLALVLEDQLGTELPLYAVFAQRSRQPARIRAFVDAAASHFERR
ncbi:MAG: LysR family transcriptional regulator [Deltaproteobacteria bacterium]|nr:MAG: LysR family transcriptional regulator [Deltaproteobacteria bacterium]